VSATAHLSDYPRSPAVRERDAFLDLLRALALARVVLWHASGWPPVTAVAAIPTMFFVSGTLFAASATHGALRVSVDRIRRILPPLWLFAAVSWMVMATAAAATGGQVDPMRIVWWLVPLGDPTGSAWEGGWLSSPLWYLRAMLWVLLAAPVLIQAGRRVPRSTLAALGTTVFILDAGQTAGWLRPSWDERLLWQVGDLALYGLFFVLGGLHRQGALAAMSRRRWLAIGALAATGALGWWRANPPASGVVNDSQPLHLLVGTAWLAAAMAAQPWLRRLAAHPRARVPVRFLGQRSLTIYLWHAPALALGLAIVRRYGFADVRWVGRYLILAGALCVVALLAFGWMEDWAARRPPRWWPRTRPERPAHRLPFIIAGLAALALFLPLPISAANRQQTATAFTPRVPSQAPPLPVVDIAPLDTPWAEGLRIDGRLDEAALVRIAEAWTERSGIAGLSLAIARPGGSTLTAATGRYDDGNPRRVGDPIDVMSVTKLFTANLVYRQVDAGRIDLDAPLPTLAAFPDLPLTGRVTVRQLLSHRSGLVNYRDTPGYIQSPTDVTTPEQALRLSTTDVPWEGPASEARYSSTNFIVLGYLLEQVTGRSYDDLLKAELLDPLGLGRTTHLPPQPGEPHFATAGIVAEIDDLARATLALLRDHAGISDSAHREMTLPDPVAAMGAGTMSYCPCTRPDPDRVEPFAIGYTGGTTWAAYVPHADVVIVADITGGVHDDHWGPVESLVHYVAEHAGTSA
jgi:CubicO group peptidase (beta-lactamase class C family)/peptidoglycan/LPS O-acetylase OafA/YrhL